MGREVSIVQPRESISFGLGMGYPPFSIPLYLIIHTKRLSKLISQS